MIRAGITGGIGSGKTMISKIFALLGIPVFCADAAAKTLLAGDPEVVRQIREEFGEKAYLAGGLPDRGYIASQVFDDEKRLARLNAIVHPATFKAMDEWTAKQSNVPYVLKEAALLFESGSAKDCDFTLLVLADEQVRIERVIARDGLSEAQIRARMGRQMSDAEKRPLADYIIHNSGKELVITQVLAIHEKLLKAAKNG